jgi:hypothetical protein
MEEPVVTTLPDGYLTSRIPQTNHINARFPAKSDLL